MSWIAMYLLPPDIELLNDWLNQEPEIAFLAANGPAQWIAQQHRNIKGDIGNQIARKGYEFLYPDFAEYNLWHIPSGPLPLLSLHDENDGLITDPWTGWTEERSGQNPRKPYFGPGHTGIINLEIKMPSSTVIPMSNFGWIGNHYRVIGQAADKSTEVFWKRLRSSIKKMSVYIPRANSQGGKNEVFAFPAAYEGIRNGRPCAVNP
ncbi:hypothetical protein MON38_07810 [Hymenobacter sp. DH14]|uniref:Uncharacterized protein n=1 Tax=Hymenobacter cyanobacteriorum TaxID=2926463 RepID=A0A9X1VFT5_9BACT|nr:hypothetical protein [Hymenobacter cyanobacteriorum]MCI1187323.1 hypothetical protein [Hymenobacter cyanobacteriorum]